MGVTIPQEIKEVWNVEVFPETSKLSRGKSKEFYEEKLRRPQLCQPPQWLFVKCFQVIFR